MTKAIPKTRKIYGEVLNALHQSVSPMSTSEINQKIGDNSNAVSLLTSGLLNQVEGYSPIKRIGHDKYVLHDWAREVLDVEGSIPDPRYINGADLSQEITAEEAYAIAGLLEESLKASIEGLQYESSMQEILQHLAGVNHEELKNIAPHLLMGLLDVAIARVDESTEGTVFFWEQSKELRIIGGHQAKGKKPWFITTVPSLALYERVRDLLWGVGGMVSHEILHPIIGRISQAIIIFKDGPTRIYLSNPGETIQEHHINSLLKESQHGEKLQIYAMGRVLPQAAALAASKGIEIIVSNETHKTLGFTPLLKDGLKDV